MTFLGAEEQGKHNFISTVYLYPTCFSFEHLQNMQFHWILAVALKTFGMVGTLELTKNQRMGYVSLIHWNRQLFFAQFCKKNLQKV